MTALFKNPVPWITIFVIIQVGMITAKLSAWEISWVWVFSPVYLFVIVAAIVLLILFNLPK